MLRKRGKFWHVLYRNADKKLIWVSTKKTEELDAQQFELDFLKAVREKTESGRLAAFVEKATEQKVEIKGMPLAGAWTFFDNEFCRDASDNIRNKKRCQLKNFIAWIGKHYPGVDCMHEVTYLMAKAYSQHLLKSGITAHTHNIYIGYLKEIFKRLMFPASISKNPFDYIKPPQASHVSYRTLTTAEITKLLKNANADWKTAILISLYTGFDFANVRRLQWADIETAEYGGKVIQVINTERAKTGAKLHIPVHPVLWTHLKQYENRANGQNRYNGQNRLENKYILPRIFQTRGCEEYFPALLKTCGIKENESGNVGFHCLRHTFNSKLDEHGVETGTRQRLTGHSSVNMNLVYTHAVKPLADAIFKIPKWNPKKRGKAASGQARQVESEKS